MTDFNFRSNCCAEKRFGTQTESASSKEAILRLGLHRVERLGPKAWKTRVALKRNNALFQDDFMWWKLLIKHLAGNSWRPD